MSEKIRAPCEPPVTRTRSRPSASVREGRARGFDHHRTHRISGEKRLRGHAVRESAKRLKPLGDRIGTAGEKAVGAADDGVAFMQKGRHAKPCGRQHRRDGRVAAKTNHRARFHLFEKRARRKCAPDEGQHGLSAGKRRASARGRGGQFVNGAGGKIAAILRRPFIGDEMHRKAARGERMGEGGRRKQMPARAARRDRHRAFRAHANASAFAFAKSATPGRLRNTASKNPIARASEISEEPP